MFGVGLTNCDRIRFELFLTHPDGSGHLRKGMMALPGNPSLAKEIRNSNLRSLESGVEGTYFRHFFFPRFERVLANSMGACHSLERSSFFGDER